MVIGLVGKSCSGKNEVGKVLQKLGLEVWDLDEIAHDGLEVNANAIEALFGAKAVRREKGKVIVDRKVISDVVFSDPSMRTKLEGILYPWLEAKAVKWAKDNPNEVLVLNGALLYRAGFNKICDSVIYVEASFGTRLKRAIKRDGVTEEQFKKREASQEDVDYKVVDYGVPVYLVSTEDGDMDKLCQQVFNICDTLGIVKKRT